MKTYYWEKELDKLLSDYLQDEYYGSSADVKLFILKVIEYEKSAIEEEILELFNNKDGIAKRKTIKQKMEEGAEAINRVAGDGERVD
jgi:hypothetical protein